MQDEVFSGIVDECKPVVLDRAVRRFIRYKYKGKSNASSILGTYDAIQEISGERTRGTWSCQDIGEVACLCRQTVSEALKCLDESGIIDIQPQPRDDKGHSRPPIIIIKYKPDVKKLTSEPLDPMLTSQRREVNTIINKPSTASVSTDLKSSTVQQTANSQHPDDAWKPPRDKTPKGNDTLSGKKDLHRGPIPSGETGANRTSCPAYVAYLKARNTFGLEEYTPTPDDYRCMKNLLGSKIHSDIWFAAVMAFFESRKGTKYGMSFSGFVKVMDGFLSAQRITDPNADAKRRWYFLWDPRHPDYKADNEFNDIYRRQWEKNSNGGKPWFPQIDWDPMNPQIRVTK